MRLAKAYGKRLMTGKIVLRFVNGGTCFNKMLPTSANRKITVKNATFLNCAQIVIYNAGNLHIFQIKSRARKGTKN